MNYWTFSKTPCNMREKPPPLPCLWWSILTTLVVHHILRSEELALFTIFWWGKPLLGWYILSFSAVWTIASLCSLTSPLIKCTVSKNIQNHAAKVIFAKADISMLNHFSKSFTGSQSKKGHSSREPPLLSNSLMVPCRHTCHPVS